MRRHKIVAQILLILAIINVTLAAPVVVREVCEACANGVDIGEGVEAVSWKRVDGGGSTQASQESKLTSASEHEDGSFAVHPASDSDHESMEVHGASSPKQTFTQADWQSMFTNRPWWTTKGRLPPSPVSSTASEDSGRAESTPAVHAPPPPESDHESDTDRRPTEGHLSNNPGPGSWTTSVDGSTTSDDASMEVHEANSPKLPLTQSDRWSMSTNPPSSPASSTFSDHGSTDYHTGIESASSSNLHPASSEFHPSSDNYLTPGENHPSLDPDDHRADGHWMTSSEEPESMSFLSKLVSKLKFWRRIFPAPPVVL
jgi:hypothetical protein